MLFVDSVLKVERLVRLVLLSALDLGLKALSWANCDTFRETSALVGVRSDIALARLVSHLGSGARVVTREDLVGPLGLFELLRLDVGHQHRRLLLLALGVIKFKGCIVLGVRDRKTTRLLETVL